MIFFFLGTFMIC